MGLFSRRRAATPSWQPPVRPHCACSRHLDEKLLASVVPFSRRLAEDIGFEPDAVTVAELLHPGGLSVQPTDDRDQSAGFTWTLGVYDDAQVHVDDDAELELDAVLASAPGVNEVSWDDREVLVLAAPTLCADGVLVAAALTLMDDRVRASS